MRLIVVLITLLIGNAVVAQTDGRALVLEHIEQLVGASKLADGKVFYVDTEVISYPRNDLSNPKKINIKMYLGKEIQFYDAGIVKTYQDSVDVFIVVFAKRTIFRKDVADSDISAKIVKGAVFQKELINNSELTGVEERMVDGNKWLSINFKIKPEITETTGLESMEFLYNTKKESIGEVSLRYASTNQLALQVMKYNHLTMDYKGEKMNAPASGYIFDQSKRLKAAYSGYKLIDLRDSNYETSMIR
jgi:hypothetical protein